VSPRRLAPLLAGALAALLGCSVPKEAGLHHVGLGDHQLLVGRLEGAVVEQRDLDGRGQAELARQNPGDVAVADALADSYRKEIDFLQESVVRGDLP